MSILVPFTDGLAAPGSVEPHDYDCSSGILRQSIYHDWPEAIYLGDSPDIYVGLLA